MTFNFVKNEIKQDATSWITILHVDNDFTFSVEYSFFYPINKLNLKLSSFAFLDEDPYLETTDKLFFIQKVNDFILQIHQEYDLY